MSTIKFRRGSSMEWARANPILASGEPGVETDSGRHKIGNGSATWESLPYFISETEVVSEIRNYVAIVNAKDVGNGIKGDGVTDDTAAINALIAKSPAGSSILFPRGEYRITEPIRLKRDVHIRGVNVSGAIGDVAELEGGEATFIGVPRNQPYLTGTVFRQDGAGKNGMEFFGPGTCNLYSFGIKFGPSIMLNDTGHGIICTPTPSGRHFGNGLWGSTWDDIWIFGHDGDHYGVVCTNGIYNRMDHIYTFGGGGLKLTNDGVGTASYGNSVFPNVLIQMFARGSAHGIHLRNETLRLNFLLFGRLQVMIYDRSSVFGRAGVPSAANQRHWKADGGGIIEVVRIEQPDFESNVGASPDFSSANICRAFTWGPGYFGGLGSNVDLWRGRTRSTALVMRSPGSLTPSVRVLPQGSGAGASVATEHLNDSSGSIVISTGADPAPGKMATVTFSQPYPDGSAPTVVVGAASENIADRGLYVTDVSDAGFTIAVKFSLDSSQSGSDSYRVNFWAVG